MEASAEKNDVGLICDYHRGRVIKNVLRLSSKMDLILRDSWTSYLAQFEVSIEVESHWFQH